MDKRTEAIQKLNQVRTEEELQAIAQEVEQAIDLRSGLLTWGRNLQDVKERVKEALTEEADGWQGFVNEGRDMGIPGMAGYSSKEECQQSAIYWRKLAEMVQAR